MHTIIYYGFSQNAHLSPTRSMIQLIMLYYHFLTKSAEGQIMFKCASDMEPWPLHSGV